jgi:hypothetical protein
MVTSIGSTSRHCIFLMLICDAIIPAFPLFWGFIYDYLKKLHPNGTFSWDSCCYNQTCLEHARATSYSPQKDLSNDVLHALINDLFTLALRGFVVGSQIPNLISDLSFDHNSCFSDLNEQ